MKKSKVNINGVTGWPPFLITRIQGRLDGKRYVVQMEEGCWRGAYIENKSAAYNAFVHATFTQLERDTAPLHKESTELAVEYEIVREQLLKPEQKVDGRTASIQARNVERIAASRERLEKRKQEILTRLACIDEDLHKAVNEAANLKREAASLAAKRVQAYLHGVALSQRRTETSTFYQVTDDFVDEEDYTSRHRVNDDRRQRILREALKEVSEA